MLSTNEKSLQNQSNDIEEFITMIKELNPGEKHEVKGILKGIMLMREMDKQAG